MAKKKKKINFLNDAPVTLSFAVLAVLVFVFDSFILKGRLSATVLFTPTSVSGEFPFSFSSPLSYLRLFFHVLGFTDGHSLLCNLIIILLLGPEIEKKYGSVIIAIMIFVSAFFAGVLSASFCSLPSRGAASVVFMTVFLSGLTFFSKKSISLSTLAVFLLVIFKEALQHPANGALFVIISIAGGIAGSLFAFLASPSARKSRKNPEIEVEELPKKRTLFGKKKKESDSEETVVGKIEF